MAKGRKRLINGQLLNGSGRQPINQSLLAVDIATWRNRESNPLTRDKHSCKRARHAFGIDLRGNRIRTATRLYFLSQVDIVPSCLYAPARIVCLSWWLPWSCYPRLASWLKAIILISTNRYTVPRRFKRARDTYVGRMLDQAVML